MRSMSSAPPLHLHGSPSIQGDELSHSSSPVPPLLCIDLCNHTARVTNATSASHSHLPWAAAAAAGKWSPSVTKLSRGVRVTQPQSSFRGGSPSHRGGTANCHLPKAALSLLSL